MKPYQYVVLRCMPRVEREEFINVGVVLYCQEDDFLDLGAHVDPDRLRALTPATPVQSVEEALAFLAAVCRGEPAAGAAGQRDLSSRFGFVKAPRSTVVQPGPVHGGLADDPAAELARLVDCLVR